jgi:hypothetical protein
MFERVMKLQALIRVRNRQTEASIKPQTSPPRTHLQEPIGSFFFLFIFLPVLVHFRFFSCLFLAEA